MAVSTKSTAVNAELHNDICATPQEKPEGALMERWAAALADSGLDTVDIAPGLADVFSVCNLSCSATIVALRVTLDENASLQHSHAAHEKTTIRTSLPVSWTVT